MSEGCDPLRKWFENFPNKPSLSVNRDGQITIYFMPEICHVTGELMRHIIAEHNELIKLRAELNPIKDGMFMWQNAAIEHKHRADNLQAELDKLKAVDA